MNLYQYCGNNPINWTDPWGLFRFGECDLSKAPAGTKNITKYVPGLWGVGLLLDALNAGPYHEEGFFEDGTHENVGYFGPDAQGNNQGVLNSTNSQSENPDAYDISPYTYDDATMRQAIQNVNNSGEFDPDDYKLIGSGKNNCQDYATALRKEYKRLGGKVKYRPFKRRQRF
jgi:hypothetical protein